MAGGRLVSSNSQVTCLIRQVGKVENVTSILGKFALVLAATGSLGFVALSPALVEAGVFHSNLRFAAAGEHPDVMQVRCDRRLKNLWSCNDNAPIRTRRDMQVRERRDGRAGYAYHPCDHSYQTARDGTHCGRRAADKNRGGR